MREKIYQQTCCLRHQMLLAQSRSSRTYIPGSDIAPRFFRRPKARSVELGPRFTEPKGRALKYRI
jgi:hypothetical protein